jgi:hypothetical protein
MMEETSLKTEVFHMSFLKTEVFHTIVFGAVTVTDSDVTVNSNHEFAGVPCGLNEGVMM